MFKYLKKRNNIYLPFTRLLSNIVLAFLASTIKEEKRESVRIRKGGTNCRYCLHLQNLYKLIELVRG